MANIVPFGVPWPENLKEAENKNWKSDNTITNDADEKNKVSVSKETSVVA